MKKVILSLVAVFALSATSCSSLGGKPSTYEDSLAYALGVDIGNSIKKTVDSTLNYKQVAQGLIDTFEKSAGMTEKEAQEFLRNYFSVVKPQKDAEAKEKASLENEKKSAEFLAKMSKESGVKASETGLLYNVETEGEGRKIQLDDTVSLHYILKDIDGKVLQSSKDMGKPFRFANKKGGMIAGFTEGISHLAKGGKTTLYIPYELGYGERGSGLVGPKAALVFEIEVLDVVEPTAKK